MKLMTLVALVCSALFSGCAKMESTETQAMNYTIGGLADLTMKTTDSASLPLIIKYTDGPKETLTLYVDRLPAGTTASYLTESGVPEFTTAFRIKTIAAPAGNYLVKVTAVGPGLMQSKELKLHIQD